MTTISVRLPERLLKDADEKAKTLDVPRAEYIRLAIETMNREIATRSRRERLAKASVKVRQESMKINAEFSRIERDPDA